MKLKQKIQELITSKREGEYWDFKEEYHDNKAAFLHDILCLANSVTKCEKFLIFGVSDPANGCQLKGLVGKTRKTQAQVIDFLRAKKFSGEIRPEVELITIEIGGVDIDVLKIFDRQEKPYYLSSTYKENGKYVNAFHIYTRNLDVNTPVTENADPRRIELMWRERFGLDIQPAKKMELLLQEPDKWEKDIGNKKVAYHKHHPEYNIRLGDLSDMGEMYSYFYVNHRSFFGNMSFRYLSVELFQLDYIYCDEMRLLISPPENGCFLIGGRTYYYHYYFRHSRAWNVFCFLSDGRFSFESRCHSAPFIVFNDHEEKERFEMHINRNPEELERPLVQQASRFILNNIGLQQQEWDVDPSDMIKVWSAYQQWPEKK